MNRLYSILTYAYPIPDNYVWYAKHTSQFVPTEKMLAIREILLSGVPSAKVAMFAATICNLIQFTCLWPAIKKLDPNNTYVTPQRPAGSNHSNQAYCMHTLIRPASEYQPLKRYLDTETQGHINMQSWLDIMAAGCLMLLRETSK